MDEGNVNVVATLVAKPGKEAAIKAEATKLLAPTRREAGCMAYDLYQSVEAPEVLVFVETWASRQHLEDHLATPHLTQFVAIASTLCAKPVEVKLYREAEGL